MLERYLVEMTATTTWFQDVLQATIKANALGTWSWSEFFQTSMTMMTTNESEIVQRWPASSWYKVQPRRPRSPSRYPPIAGR